MVSMEILKTELVINVTKNVPPVPEPPMLIVPAVFLLISMIPKIPYVNHHVMPEITEIPIPELVTNAQTPIVKLVKT
jgi:hypothetical protein